MVFQGFCGKMRFFLQNDSKTQGEQPRMGCSAVTRHGCRIDGDPNTFQNLSHSVRKNHFITQPWKTKSNSSFCLYAPAFALTNIYFFKKIITSEKSENFQMDAILYSLHNPKKKYQTSAYMLQHNGKNCQTLPLMPLLLYCRSD